MRKPFERKPAKNQSKFAPVPAVAVPRAAAFEPLEERRLMSTALSLGINVNAVTARNYKSMVQMLRDSGTTSVRLWYGFTGYGDRTLDHTADYARKFKYDGFDVTLSVVPDDGETGTAQQTADLFTWLVKQPGLTDAVDRWEIGNEEDSHQYWNGSLKTYFTDYLVPASKVLHSVGEKVVSGGVSWNPADIETLVGYGMLKWVDFVGYHPYRSTLKDLKIKVAAVKEIVGDFPLVATEWNVRGHESDSTKDAWNSDIKAFWPVIRDNFYASYYFAALTQNSRAGPAGVLNHDGSPNQPFYDTYMSLQYNMGTITGSTGSGGTGNGGTTTGGSGSGGTTTGGTTTGGGTTGGGTTSSGTTGGGSTGGSTSGGSTTGGTTHSGGGTTTGGTKGGATTGGGTTGGTTSGGTTGGGSTTGGTTSGGTTSGGTTTPVPVKKPTIAPAVGSINLFNTDRQRAIRGYAVVSGAMSVDFANVGTDLSLVAATNRKTQSVVFTIDGSNVVDSSGSFSLFGEKHGVIRAGTFRVHTYYVTAQAFSGLNGSGRAGVLNTYLITVHDSRAPATVAALAHRQAVIAERKRKLLQESGGLLDGLPA